MKITLKFVVNCEVLRMEENFQGIVLVMHFLKHVNIGKLKKKFVKT
jgi:hypothetical protein